MTPVICMQHVFPKYDAGTATVASTAQEQQEMYSSRIHSLLKLQEWLELFVQHVPVNFSHTESSMASVLFREHFLRTSEASRPQLIELLPHLTEKKAAAYRRVFHSGYEQLIKEAIMLCTMKTQE